MLIFRWLIISWINGHLSLPCLEIVQFQFLEVKIRNAFWSGKWRKGGQLITKTYTEKRFSKSTSIVYRNSKYTTLLDSMNQGLNAYFHSYTDNWEIYFYTINLSIILLALEKIGQLWYNYIVMRHLGSDESLLCGERCRQSRHLQIRL